MTFIDTHIHLYEEEFAPDLESVIQNALNNGVKKMIMPNVDVHSITAMKQIAATYPDTCLPMIGLHPCYVKDDFKAQLEVIETELNKERYYAVGEIGLDLYWDKTTLSQQKEAFAIQTRWAIERKLPIAIHSREATSDAIALLQPLVSHDLRGVFHCFSGTLEEAKDILEMGFYLGIGGVVTFKNGGLQQLLTSIPLEKLVLETDGPYLAPVPFRGKRNESAYLTYIVKKLAEIYNTSVEYIGKVTSANAEKLFGLS